MAEIKKINTDLQIEARLLDSNGSAGASGQILSSTGTATDWISLSEISGVDGTGTANYVAKWSDTDTITNSVIYDDGTNVGIGTSSPSGKLEVNTGSSAAYFTRTAGDDGLLNPVVAIAADSSKGLIAASGDSLSFRVRAVGTSNPLGGNTVMSLLSSGNVGIGTTSPNNILHLGGSANKSIRVDTALSNSAFFTGWQDSAAIGVNRNPFNGTFTDTAKAASSIFLYGQASSSYITFSTTNTNNTNPTERMRIDSSGNINIGTTSASTVGGTAKMTIDVGAFTASPVSIVNGTTDGMYIRRYSTGGSYQLQTTVGSGNSGNLSLQSYGGNVGIGTTSPGYTLDVNGTLHSSNITLADGIYHEGDTNTYINFLSDQIQMATAGSVRAYINSLGNVGIGTTSPETKLHVTKTSVSNKIIDGYSTSIVEDTESRLQLISTNSGSYGSTLILSNAEASGDQRSWSLISKGTLASNRFQIGYRQSASAEDIPSASSKFLTILNSGNVGIGTESPQSKLHIETGSGGTYNPNTNHDDVTIEGSGNIGLQLFSPNSSYQYIAFGDPDSVNAGYLRYYHGTNEMVFRTSNSDKMVINSSGNVGIGTTSPQQKLQVASPSATSVVLGTSYLSTNNNNFFEVGINANDGYLNLKNSGVSTTIHIDSDGDSYFNGGNVGIGTTSPSQKLEVVGTISSGAGAGASNLGMDFGGLLSPSAMPSQVRGVIGALNSGTGVAAGSIGYQPRTGVSAAHIFFTEQSEKMRITSTGNVGIGETNPAQKLHVIGNSEITGDIFLGRYIFHNDDTNTWFGFPLADTISFRTNGSDRMYINSSGNVGIGTTSPSSKLQVFGDLTVGDDGLVGSWINVIAAGSGQDAGIRFGSESNTDSKAAIYTNTSNSDLHFDVTETTRMLIDSATGNVGIGTTGPDSKLHISEGDLTISGYNTSRFIRFTEPDNSYQGGFINYDGGANVFYFGTHDVDNTSTSNDIRAFQIARGSSNTIFNGNVGIGTTSPTSQLGSTKVLDISSTGNGEIILDHTDAGVSSDIGLYSWNRNNDHLAHIKASCDGATDSAFISFHTQATGGSFTNAASNERMRITSTGNVGIGTTSPSSLFHLQKTLSGGQVMAYFDGAAGSGAYGAVNIRVDNIDYGTGMRFHRSGTYDSGAVGFINGTSTVGSININTSSTSYNTTSDYRLKENLTEITDGIDRIKQLKPKRFNFIGDTEIVDGFVAHEAKQVVPEAVTGEKDEVLPNGDPVYQGIDQSKIVPLLTAALQEAITKIEILENRLQTLENK